MSRQITSEDLDKILQNFAINPNFLEMNAGEKELIHSLQHVLEKLQCPLSVSFLNTSFKAWQQEVLLTFSFLEKFNSIFSVSMIGSDLKINLRKKYTTKLRKEPDFQQQLVQVLEKDAEKCKKLLQKLREGPILFNEALKQFSSNKYKMNLGFCVRNSHVLDIYLHDGETYLKSMEHVNYNVDMREEELWKFIENDKVDELAAISLENLLCKFTEPINQGTLQVLINFGFPVVDKSFLRNHSDKFEGGGDDGVMLKGMQRKSNTEKYKATLLDLKNTVFAAARPAVNPQPFTFTSFDEDVVDSSPFLPYYSYANDTNTKLMKTALNEKCTTVVLGNNTDKQPVFIKTEMTNKEQLNALYILRGHVEAEINKLKSQ